MLGSSLFQITHYQLLTDHLSIEKIPLEMSLCNAKYVNSCYIQGLHLHPMCKNTSQECW